MGGEQQWSLGYQDIAHPGVSLAPTQTSQGTDQARKSLKAMEPPDVAYANVSHPYTSLYRRENIHPLSGRRSREEVSPDRFELFPDRAGCKASVAAPMG